MRPGQAVLISEMEHHSNIVPWQMLRDAARHRAAGRPCDRCRRAGHGRPSRRCSPTARSGSSRSPTCRTCSAPNAGRAHRRGSPMRTGRKVLLDGIAGGRAPARGCAGARLPISTPSPATSCTARPASACSGRGASCWSAMPPFMGGGDMISSVTLGAHDLGARPAQIRGGHAGDPRGDRTAGGDRLRRVDRLRRRSRRMRRR